MNLVTGSFNLLIKKTDISKHDKQDKLGFPLTPLAPLPQILSYEIVLVLLTTITVTDGQESGIQTFASVYLGPHFTKCLCG